VIVGRVSAFDEPAGLGAITAADGVRYPFHCVEIADGTRTIEVGTDVEFEPLRKLGRVEAAAIRPTRR
jgi:CspA family cold shock protein